MCKRETLDTAKKNDYNADMTIRQQIQDKIDRLREELSSLESHLAAGGPELDHTEESLRAWMEEVIAKVKAILW